MEGGPADPSTEVSNRGGGGAALNPHLPHITLDRRPFMVPWQELKHLSPFPSSSAPLPRFRSFSFSPSLSLTCWPWCSSPVGATACRGCASRTGSEVGGRQTRWSAWTRPSPAGTGCRGSRGTGSPQSWGRERSGVTVTAHTHWHLVLASTRGWDSRSAADDDAAHSVSEAVGEQAGHVVVHDLHLATLEFLDLVQAHLVLLGVLKGKEACNLTRQAIDRRVRIWD